VLAAGIVALRAVRLRDSRAPWAALALGLALYMAGNLLWSFWYEPQAEPPFPSVSDLLWLSLYPLSYLGVVLIAREDRRVTPAGVWLDGIVAGLGMAALGAAIVFGKVLASSTGDAAAVAVNLAYPIADLLLAALVMGVLALRGWRLNRTHVRVEHEPERRYRGGGDCRGSGPRGRHRSDAGCGARTL
jgi:diguanylate cyclase